MPGESIGNAPGYTTVIGGEVVPAPKPEPELTMEQKLDVMNSVPSKPGDYVLPDNIMFDGEPWQPDPQQARAIDGLKAMAHAAELAPVHFGDLAEKWARPNYVTMTPEVAEAHLRNEWGAQYEKNATIVAAQLAKIEARFPGATRYLEQTGRANDVDLIRALWLAGSQRRKR